MTGKIVVYNEQFEGYGTTVTYRTTGAERAEKYGAVAALVRSVAPFGLKVRVLTGLKSKKNYFDVICSCILAMTF